MDIIHEILDCMADIATVLAFALALIETYKQCRMGRKK